MNDNNTLFTLESDRLILRNLRESDLEDFYEYRCRPEVARFQLWEPFDRQESLEYIVKYKDSLPGIPGQWFQLGIVLKEKNKLIGDCAIKLLEHEPRIAEIGCSLSTDYQGKSIAKEALTLMLDHFFLKTDLNRVVGITDAENTPSVRLMESLKMRKEGHFIQDIWFKGKWGDEFQYAILKEEWLKNRNLKKDQK